MEGDKKKVVGRPRFYDTRENQIRMYERNIKTATLFLEYLKDEDLSRVNEIVLLFDEAIKQAINRFTHVIDEQNECYQFTVLSFMDLCSRNAIRSTNLEGYLCGIVRNYFFQRSARKSRRREVSFDDLHREF